MLAIAIESAPLGMLESKRKPIPSGAKSYHFGKRLSRQIGSD